MITHIEKYASKTCGPCKVLSKTLTQITDVDIIEYDADNDEDLFSEKGIRNVPTLIFYDGYNEVERLVGAVPLATINKVIETWKEQ